MSNYFYFSKDLENFYINSGAPTAKSEEGRYKVYVTFVARVKDGDVFKLDGHIREVIKGDRLSRLEIVLPEKQKAELTQKIETLFPKVVFKD